MANDPRDYVSTLNAPETPNTFYRVNDALLYMSTGINSNSMYTLTYNTATNNWTWSSITITQSTSTTNNFQSTMDACGRLWVSVNGYGIHIFDLTAMKLLYNWTLSSGVNGIVLTQNFNLYVADYDNNKIFGYRPGIGQCTWSDYVCLKK
jgi:hypothetical protein